MGRFRAAAAVLAAAGVLAAAAAVIFGLRDVADDRRGFADQVSALRVEVLQAEALAWQGLNQELPDITLRREIATAQATILRQSRRLQRADPGPQTASIVQLTEHLSRGLTLERAGLEALDVGRVARPITRTLVSTSEDLDRDLNEIARTADARASDADGKADAGTLAALGTAAAMIWLLAVLGARGRRLGEQRERSAGEQRLRALVHHSHEIVAVVSRDGTLRWATEGSLQRVLGRDAAALEGRPLADLLGDGDHTRLTTALTGLASEGTPERTEWAVTHADGRTVQLEAVGQNRLADPLIEGLVITLRDITAQKRMEEELRHQAFHDSLTGLANRALFEDRLGHALARAERRREAVAVLFIDLDDFKWVNDSLGHTAGDTLLAALGEQIHAALRTSDTAARLGGDEFAVVLEGADADEAMATAHRVMRSIATPVRLGDREVTARASIGVVVASPCTGSHPGVDELLRNADLAMYAAKGGGKGGVRAFDETLLADVHTPLQVSEDLGTALERGQLHLHYQPVMDLAGGRARGVEALLRWTHPERGPIPPGTFIPIAERSGLICPIGLWVLRQACLDLPDLAGSDERFSMNVNVSAVQLRDPEFPAQVADTLAQTGVPPERIMLELTESTIMAGPAIETAIRALRGIGVGISVDDFGTGYSSLAYLHRLEVDEVKIDRSFLAEIDQQSRDAAFVRSLVELAHTLGLTIVAEGIERDSQAAAVRATGCEYAQGFHFGRPAPLADASRTAATV